MKDSMKQIVHEVMLEHQLDTKEKHMEFRRSHPEIKLPTATTILAAYNAVGGKSF